jgi:NAD(P)-dependent dehydrogenase (short-subunit alcohol dehydrogenase family)
MIASALVTEPKRRCGRDISPDTAWTADDIPDQRGRVAVITGANTGVGLATATQLARHGAHVVLAVRNLDKGNAAAASIRSKTPSADVSIQQLDLASLDSVYAAAAELDTRLDRIDLLINNAGVMAGARPRSTTDDGFEMHFGTNHLGHFALTGLLLGHVLAAPNSRVVTVSSVAHRLQPRIHFEDLQSLRTYRTTSAYGQSKLANLMFVYELQRRLAAHHSTSIAVTAHPGGTRTDLARDSSTPVKLFNSLLLQTPDMGALPTLRAATDPSVSGGQYFGPRGILEARGYPKIVRSSKQSHDTAAQRRLWAISEELTGVRYPI